jgi:hypothetical protein
MGKSISRGCGFGQKKPIQDESKRIGDESTTPPSDRNIKAAGF